MKLFADSIEAARQRHQFDLWAYVFMPNHAHLFLIPRQDSYDISSILAGIKRPVAYHARRLGVGDQLPHFWQEGGGYDRNLFEPKAIHAEIDYLHANPVRKGLCNVPEEWKYSSAAFWAGRKDVPMLMDETVPPLVG